MPSRSRRPSSEELRLTVIRHAIRLIAEQGFGAISIAEVAQAAGLSKQALLYHFNTKEALKDAVITHLLEHANRALIGLMSAFTGDEARRFEQLLESVQSFFDAEPYAAPVLLRFLLDRDEPATERIRQGVLPWFRVTVDALRRGQRDGRLRPELDAEATVAQVGMLILTNFALLPIHGLSDSSPEAWRKRRLGELIRATHLILFREGRPDRRRPGRGAGTPKPKPRR